jgi:hypothetical protein
MADRHAAWSNLRLRLAPVAPAWLVLLLGGSFAAAAAGWRRSSGRQRLFREAMLFLVLLAVLEFFVCAFADRLADAPRHLFVFHAFCDLLLAANLTWLAQRASTSWRALPMRKSRADESEGAPA